MAQPSVITIVFRRQFSTVSSSKRLTRFFVPSTPPRPRTFTHKSSLLLVSRPNPRPQLPFLHPSSANQGSTSFRSHITRFISTERKARWKANLRWHLRFQAYFWPSAFLVVVIIVGLQQTRIESDYPTPREWTFWTRWYLRSGLYTELSQDAKVERVLTDWQAAGEYYRRAIKRLEDHKYDGSNIVDRDEGGILVDGVGKTGYDITVKSEPWRRGYYQTLMAAARVAEHLEDKVKVKGEESGRIYDKENIPGPSNPRPKPLPWDKKGRNKNPPQEHEVEAAYSTPEVFYMKILTTYGFDNGQRLEAALAYADWCDFRGLPDTASSTYDWALDIAAGGLPLGSNNVVDMMTGVISKGKEEYVSQNLLRAATALGVHHARKGEVKEALPIFLSVLRARKSLPPMPIGTFMPVAETKNSERSPVWEYVSALKDYFLDKPYPPPLPSGDGRPHHTLAEACEEVGLMTYIGEILFATSKSEKEKGLSWTRDSVEAAEAILWVMEEQNEDTGKERCRECLQTGLANWKDMATEMSRLAAKEEVDAEKSSGWLGTSLGKDSNVQKARENIERWNEEQLQVELRKQKTISLTQPLRPTVSGWLSRN